MISHADAIMLRSLTAVGKLFAASRIDVRAGYREAAETLLDAMDSLGNVDLAEDTDAQDEGI